MSKAEKIWTSGQVAYTSPNLGELLAMYDAMTGEKTVEDLRDLSKAPVERILTMITEISAAIVERVPNLLVTLGSGGLFVCRRANDHDQKFPNRENQVDTSNVVAVHYSTQPDLPVVSVSGAGDCMVGAMITSILHNHHPHIVCTAGLKAAHQSLSSYYTVPPEMTSQQYTPEVVTTWAQGLQGHVVEVNGRGRTVKIPLS